MLHHTDLSTTDPLWNPRNTKGTIGPQVDSSSSQLPHLQSPSKGPHRVPKGPNGYLRGTEVCSW
jgi:hypothetical protein